MIQSKFGGGEISMAQWLAEHMCSRKAISTGAYLGDKFWNKEIWKLEYAHQVRQANALLKVYSWEAILAALNTKQGQRAYSLAGKWLHPYIKEQQDKINRKQKLNQQATKDTEPENYNIIDKELRPQQKMEPSLLANLRKLD